MCNNSIIIVKNSDVFTHVRVRKFIKVFNDLDFDLKYVLWDRDNSLDKNENLKILHRGGGYSSSSLIGHYLLWMLKVFLYFFRHRDSNNLIYVVDFDSAFPIYLAKLFNPKINYIYDIHDDFSLRYNFGHTFKNVVSYLDYKVKRKSYSFIHVDENRIREKDCRDKMLIIYNTPEDFYKEKKIELSNKPFVVSGLLVNGRGLESIYKFAMNHPDNRFLIAGNRINSDSDQLIELDNVNYLGILDQHALFDIINDSKGIFSLYDPNVEINRLAASNKLYDAMMLGIPVITNYGLLASDYVKKNEIGIVLDFEYNSSWAELDKLNDKKIFEEFSRNARKIYLEKYSFEKNYNSKITEILKKYKVENNANHTK